MRIAVGGFLHESHSFAPRPTTYADFLHPGGLPPFLAGEDLIPATRSRSVPLAGAIAAAEATGVDLVPLAWGFANPAGPVQDEAFERIAARICAPLSVALDQAPLDGVYLDLHGAAMVDSFPDAEGELLRRVRAIVGAAMPLTISLDPHANLTWQMVRLADVVVPFRTYPHVDMKAAGARAMQLLLDRTERGQPWERAFRQLDFWIPLGSQCTLMPPMQTVMTEREDLAERLGAVELAFCFGFPYADFAGCGPAVAAFADTQARADAAADGFLAYVDAQEARFVQDTLPTRSRGRSTWHRERPDRWCWRIPRTTRAAAAMVTPPNCWPNWCVRVRRGRWSASSTMPKAWPPALRLESEQTWNCRSVASRTGCRSSVRRGWKS
jgi:microcystin degradation protein MlrC